MLQFTFSIYSLAILKILLKNSNKVNIAFFINSILQLLFTITLIIIRKNYE